MARVDRPAWKVTYRGLDGHGRPSIATTHIEADVVEQVGSLMQFSDLGPAGGVVALIPLDVALIVQREASASAGVPPPP